MKKNGFGLIMILISLLIVMLLFTSGFYLLRGGSKNGAGGINYNSPLKKADDAKEKYNNKNKEAADYLNNN